MDLEGMLAFFRELEEKYPVDKWRVNGVAVWPLIRLKLAEKKRNLNVGSKTIKGRLWQLYVNKIMKVLFDIVKVCINDYKHQQKIEKADFVFLGDAGDRNIKMPDGTFFDHNHDPLKIYLQRKGYTAFSFEELGGDRPHLPRWSNSYIIDKIVLLCLIKKKILKRNCKHHNIKIERYDEFLKDLQGRNIDDKGLIVNELTSKVFFLQALSDSFVEILNIVKPRAVVHECWYGDTKMALALAAHRLKIPVIEIQHGAAASKRHPSYYNWSKIPKTGYTLMPDYMWVWDEDDYLEMSIWAKNSMRPFVGGHPMNLLWFDSRNELSRYYSCLYDKCFGNSKKTILITLQPGNIYPQWFIDYINVHEEYNWLIRLHPIVDECEKTFLKRLLKKDNIKVDNVSEFPLEILLKYVDLHVTASSSVVLDAEIWNKRSIIIDNISNSYYDKLMKRRMAFYGGDLEVFSMLIKELLINSQNENRAKFICDLHEENQAAINKIIDIANMDNRCEDKC